MPHQQPVVSVVTADEHRFDLIHVPAQDARHSLLFLPGMGLSARQYISFGQALAGFGIETFIHEWRGLGSSSQRAGRRFNWGYRELLEEDLLSAVAQVSESLAGRKLIIGGHSLGSQLACLLAALRPEACSGLVIVAGGAPYWRAYSGWMRWTLPAIFLGMPAVARLVGHYPGRRLGFAGREALGVVRDWAASGRSGVYAPPGMTGGLEQAMRALQIPVLSLRMADDWFVPPTSLDWLTGKLASARLEQRIVEREALGGPADHYRWMREPNSSAGYIDRWLDREFRAGHSEASRAAAISRA